MHTTLSPCPLEVKKGEGHRQCVCDVRAPEVPHPPVYLLSTDDVRKPQSGDDLGTNTGGDQMNTLLLPKKKRAMRAAVCQVGAASSRCSGPGSLFVLDDCIPYCPNAHAKFNLG